MPGLGCPSSFCLRQQGCGGRSAEDQELLERPADSPYCYACLSDLAPTVSEDAPAEMGVVVSCPDCRRLFCFDCDAYIHETLHNCPGCLCSAEDEAAAALEGGSNHTGADGVPMEVG